MNNSSLADALVNLIQNSDLMEQLVKGTLDDTNIRNLDLRYECLMSHFNLLCGEVLPVETGVKMLV